MITRIVNGISHLSSVAWSYIPYLSRKGESKASKKLYSLGGYDVNKL